MERRSLLVLSGLGVVYLAGGAAGQLFEDPTKTYRNMTFEFDVRHRGGLEVPLCIKQLMDCWEVMKADIMCSHSQVYETACMLMKMNRCHDLEPFGQMGWPYTHFHMVEAVCTGIDNDYTRHRRVFFEHAASALGLGSPGA